MHKIFLEKGHKPSIKPQKYLNPIMREVENKEILKWLEVGIICTIVKSTYQGREG